MHIRTNRYKGIKPSKATVERVERRLELQAKRAEWIPTRHDFTAPRQHVKLALKAAAQGFVWPTIA